VVLQSGCLACHRIGNEGTSSIGPNLSDVGARLTARAITRALRHPTPPMPSFADLSRRDFRALVAYLVRLHGS
jgi:menaquinol-cytochrome c reductase cytochrome b/c subunit